MDSRSVKGLNTLKKADYLVKPISTKNKADVYSITAKKLVTQTISFFV